MKLKNIKQVEELLAAVNQAKGDVWIESMDGDKLSLKSVLSQYVALGALLGNHGDEFDLYCARKDDEHLFLNFFKNNPDAL